MTRRSCCTLPPPRGYQVGDSRGDCLTARLGPRHLGLVMVSRAVGIVLLKKCPRRSHVQRLAPDDRPRRREPGLFSLVRLVEGLFGARAKPIRLLLTRTSRRLARRDVQLADKGGPVRESGFPVTKPAGGDTCIDLEIGGAIVEELSCGGRSYAFTGSLPGGTMMADVGIF